MRARPAWQRRPFGAERGVSCGRLDVHFSWGFVSNVEDLQRCDRVNTAWRSAAKRGIKLDSLPPGEATAGLRGLTGKVLSKSCCWTPTMGIQHYG